MKEKIQSHRTTLVIIQIVLISISIYFFYIDKFSIGLILSLILIVILLIKNTILYKDLEEEYLDEEYLENRMIENINENVLNSIYPITLIESTGNIKWANKIIIDILQLSNYENENIISLVRELNLNKLLKCDKNTSQIVKIKDYVYSVYAKEINKDDKKLYSVYFVEISNLKNSNSTKESILLIEIDNLKEVLESINEEDRPTLVADVEKIITTYATNLNAMLVKYKSNEFVLSILDKYINSEIDNKFNILKKVSQIDRGNKFEVTLSIGVGRGGIAPNENYNNAIKAKELALGRGGNQVVVKDKENVTFYGGNSREVEKRTRVRARVIAKAIKELIYESSNIVIIGHKNPDMDCLGAAVGIAAATNKLGKRCNIILDKDTTGVDYYLDKLKEDNKYYDLFINSEEAEKNINDKTLLIIVDVHNKSYVNNISLVNKVNRKIIIDHHRRSADMIEGTLLNYIEVYASSTCEMVTELIQYMLNKDKISKIEAEGLLAGIVMDTKGFQFKSGVRTFDAASFLRTLGADPLEVKKMFTDSFEDYLIISETIRYAKLYNNLAIAITPKGYSNSILVAKAADELLSISGINVCFVLSRINDKITISGRSIGDINVQIILEDIGGGGHINMAGTQLDMPIEEAVDILKKSISNHLDIEFN